MSCLFTQHNSYREEILHVVEQTSHCTAVKYNGMATLPDEVLAKYEASTRTVILMGGCSRWHITFYTQLKTKTTKF